MSDGSIVISTEIDSKKAEAELKRLTKAIEKASEALSRSRERKSGIEAELAAAKKEALKTEQAIRSLKTELARVKEITGGIVSSDPNAFFAAKARQVEITAQLKEQEAILVQQDKDTQRIDTQYTKIVDKVIQQSQDLEQAETRAGDLSGQMAGVGSSSEKMAKAMDQVHKSAKRFALRLREVIKSALVFTLITQALASFRNWMGKVIKTNDEATAAMARLKGGLLTLVQPLVNVIVPIFTAFVNLLANIITSVVQLISSLLGTTAETSANAAESLYNETEAITGVGKAAKKASGSLAGFDEINKLSGDTYSGGGGANNVIKPNFRMTISDELTKIATLVGGALLAVGAILTFSGANIPLGLGLMSVGALTLVSAVATHWSDIVNMLRGPLGMVSMILGGALLVLGAVLTFSGANIPLGIGLMMAGAAGMAVSVGANWDTLSAALRGPIGLLTALLSGALLAVGAILAFSGANLPLGIGLIAVGAAGLAMTIAANWETIQQTLKGPIGAITVLISGALLVVGAVLAFSGANIPLGIGLLAAGALGLAASLTANWETIQQTLQGPIGTITAMMSAALLVIGAILVFSGAALPLGIGLIALGAVGLATSIVANWDTITSTLGSTFDAVTAIISAALLVLGVILIFTGAGIPLGLGMLLAGGAGLAATVAPKWDFILEKLKGAWSDVRSWWTSNVAKYFRLDFWHGLGANVVNGFMDGLKDIFSKLGGWVSGVKDYITGALTFSVSTTRTYSAGARSMPMEHVPAITPQSVPALAAGAVIPPNREFMAVLGDQRHGTNLEAPEELIRKIVREESGGGDATVSLLQSILSAVREGKVLVVDKKVLARVTAQGINDMTRAAGKSVLLI